MSKRISKHMNQQSNSKSLEVCMVSWASILVLVESVYFSHHNGFKKISDYRSRLPKYVIFSMASVFRQLSRYVRQCKSNG